MDDFYLFFCWERVESFKYSYISVFFDKRFVFINLAASGTETSNQKFNGLLPKTMNIEGLDGEFVMPSHIKGLDG